MSLAANVVAAVQAVAADIKALYTLANAALPKSGGAVTGPISIGNVANQITISRYAAQYLTIENNDQRSSATLTSYSSPSNAKQIIYDSRTDAAGSAVTAGGLGHVFSLNGASKLVIGSSGVSISGNFSNSGGGTFGNTVSVTGDVKAIAGTLASYRFSSSAPISGYSASGTSASPTAISAPSTITQFIGRAYDGTTYQTVGFMGVVTDGAISSTSSPGSLTFSTTQSGSLVPSEAMRITSGQRILAGTTTDNGTDRLQVSGSLSVSGKAVIGGPLSVGSYTLTTLPSASAYSGYYITVSNATGGPKLCYSNGTNWVLVNTTTTVS